MLLSIDFQCHCQCQNDLVVIITKGVPGFSPTKFKMDAQEIFRKAADGFLYQDINVLYDVLTEPLFNEVRD